MRGNHQDPYLRMESSSSNYSLSSTDALIQQDTHTSSSQRNGPFPAYSNPFMSTDGTNNAVNASNAFQRRRSVQSTTALNQSLSRSYHRRGSIPCLSISAQNSPQLSPKKSHTAPNPFPELINSPPPTPSINHRRSRSSNMDDRSWLTPEELEADFSTLQSSPSGQLLTKQDSQSSDNITANANDSQQTQSSQQPVPPSQSNVHSSRLSSIYNASDSSLNSTQHNTALPRSDSKYLYTQMSNGSDVAMRKTSVPDRYSPPSRHSPTNGYSDRRSPECQQGVIYEQASALITPHGYTKQMLKVYTDDKNYRTVTINEIMPASEVCHMLVQDSGYLPNKNWTMVEVLPKFDLGMCVCVFILGSHLA